MDAGAKLPQKMAPALCTSAAMVSASIGDYLAGPSHVLPTYGSARFSSALTVGDFMKDHHVVTITEEGLRHLGPHVMALADQEGLAAHGDSVRLRMAGSGHRSGGDLA
jgi:histidinol dehydrogenase